MSATRYYGRRGKAATFTNSQHLSHVRTIVELESSDDNGLHIYPLGCEEHCKYEADSSQPVCRDISLPLGIIKVDDIARRWRYEDQYPVNDRHGDNLEILGSDGSEVKARPSKESV